MREDDPATVPVIVTIGRKTLNLTSLRENQAPTRGLNLTWQEEGGILTLTYGSGRQIARVRGVSWEFALSIAGRSRMDSIPGVRNRWVVLAPKAYLLCHNGTCKANTLEQGLKELGLNVTIVQSTKRALLGASVRYTGTSFSVGYILKALRRKCRAPT